MVLLCRAWLLNFSNVFIELQNIIYAFYFKSCLCCFYLAFSFFHIQMLILLFTQICYLFLFKINTDILISYLWLLGFFYQRCREVLTLRKFVRFFLPTFLAWKSYFPGVFIILRFLIDRDAQPWLNMIVIGHSSPWTNLIFEVTKQYI